MCRMAARSSSATKYFRWSMFMARTTSNGPFIGCRISHRWKWKPTPSCDSCWQSGCNNSMCIDLHRRILLAVLSPQLLAPRLQQPAADQRIHGVDEDVFPLLQVKDERRVYQLQPFSRPRVQDQRQSSIRLRDCHNVRRKVGGQIGQTLIKTVPQKTIEVHGGDTI